MFNPVPNVTSTADRRSEEDRRVVSAILEQIPELQKVKQVRQRDGSVVDFKPEQVGLTLSAALAQVGLNDQLILARCTHQTLMRLEREFDGHAVPTMDDVSRIVVGVLIDNNLSFAAKKYFATLQPEQSQPPQFVGGGLKYGRLFSRVGKHPYDEIEWERRDAVIKNEKGKTVFEQLGVEVPKSWSQSATNIVASKYFRGEIGKSERETSVRQMVDRVAQTIAGWGRKDGYFATEADADTFEAELTSILVNQRAAFNSPVWFNVGVNPRPQCSACFINSVRDDMRSILNLVVTEGMLFKYGSGTGTNLSSLRSSKELLANSSGKSSGPVSFMKGFDAFAGVIKSGGKTRRAAKMVILNVDHPDIEEFVGCKVREERKAKKLISAGYDASMDGDAYSSVFFQNANNSVRVNDDFMGAAVDGREWTTRAVTTGQPVGTMPAKSLLRKISEATWECGDPGLQFDTTVNRWNPVPNSGRINASNPCVTGDTLVATSEGWRRIDSLLDRSFRAVGSDGRTHDVSPAFLTGTKPVYRLVTKTGLELKLTADHRVLTANRGDVQACELTKNDVVLLGRPGFGSSKLDERLGEFLGLMLGDGCVSGEQRTATLTLSPEESAVADRVHARLAEFRQANAADGRGSRETQVSNPQGTLRINTSVRCVIDELDRLAVLDRGGEGKALLPDAFSLDRESLAAILRGLFTADGTVADYGQKSQYVGLDSISSELLRQVQLLLLSFGVKSKIYRNRRAIGQATALLPDGHGGTKEYQVSQIHSLRISRSSRIVFEREIGFVAGSVKSDRLAAMNRSVGVYRDQMEDGIESIEWLGEEKVYDLTEPDTSHFVASGLVVHNCSEYMFLDDSACNLSSLNLQKFVRDDGSFDTVAFRQASEIMITAMEIVVGNSSYPTPAIEENSYDFRALGIGYANLGALLMSRGLAYDSDDGRNFAAAVTALLSGYSYRQSARIASVQGPFRYYKMNEEPFLRVIGLHRDYAYAIRPEGVPEDLLAEAKRSWDQALEEGMAHGFRNAQISLLAPTGTIGFLMDCDTTGIEPDIALVKYKWLVGGGLMKIVNGTVRPALVRLGYDQRQIDEIMSYLDERDTIEGAPHLKDEHLPVFDCSFRPAKGQRSIHYLGHIRMMAAVQPFLSGAISKTVNLPTEATVDDVEQAYLEAWRLGLKAIAVYRDGSKGQQVLTTSADGGKKEGSSAELDEVRAELGRLRQELDASLSRARVERRPLRRHLPDERRSVTHKFSIAGHEGYITVGLYDDGTPGEMFIRMAKGGSVISGLIDAFATTTSIALQYGVPLKVLVNKFVHLRFEPSGFTANPNIRIAKSIVDYLFRWLAMKFLPLEDQIAVGVNVPTLADAEQNEVVAGSGPEMADDLGEPEKAESAVGMASAKQMNLEEGRKGSVVAAGGSAAAQSAGTGLSSNSLTMSFDVQSDAPPCDTCGAIMVRNGACYKCMNCGSTSGCS
ncbi:MAG: LAGLIDADG family homing endonuclease [bacterium]